MNNALAVSSVVIKELYRRKDFYVLFVLTALLTLAMGSMNFFNDPHIVRYLREVCLLLIWVSALVIAITMAARQLPAERESRTIFPLLAKPITRAEVVLGKFLGCWFAAGLALVVFYVFFAVISGVRDGQWPVGLYLEGLWLHWLLLAIVIAATLLGSVVLSTPAANATLAFVLAGGIMLLGQHLNTLALRQAEPVRTILYAIYFALPHFEFFDLRRKIIHEAVPAPMWAVGAVTLYAGVYAAFFLTATCLAFRRRSLN